ncbi:MAG TPA: glutathione S-transferase family protein [Steroidobacteraceae bacterium]|jgi:glutathione S-transferase|nr:glutathione S-transferase family protein [Steroidobacteraceae bacterium]
MAAGYKLYGRQGSGSLAVQIALEEAGAPYECIWIPKDSAELEKYKKVSPAGRVPALALPDGTVMLESAAMLIHIAQAHPRAALAPAPGTSSDARFLQWIVHLSANVYESVLRIYYSARYSTRGEADAAVIRDQAVENYLAYLDFIGRALDPYVLGADYSLADPYLYMLVGWHPGEKADLWKRVPKLEAHMALIGSRPAVQKVEAEHAEQLS